MSAEALVAVDQAPVLIVEDDRFDQLILKRAFRAAKLDVSLRFVEHGGEMMDYLKTSADKGAALPAVIFLDLNMPFLNGWDTLRQLRAEPRWASIPVVAMSTLRREPEVAQIYAIGANAYFTKPTAFEDMVRTIQTNAAAWLRLPGDRLSEPFN